MTTRRLTSGAALAIVFAAGVVRLILAARIPIFPDEAYYWDWSRHLAWGYFDHPGVLPHLIAAGTALVGATPLGVRLVPSLGGIVAALVVLGMARRLTGSGDAGAAPPPGVAMRRAAWLVSLLPLAAAGLILATPDVPLLTFDALALYGVLRALQEPPRSRASTAWWIAAGVALGLAFASKYTAVLLPLGIVIALLLRRSLRARFAEPGPWLATVAALVVFSPVILWNAHHGWISVTFQLHHGLGTPKGTALKHELDLLGGQAGLASPILFVLMLVAVVGALRRTASDARFVFGVVAATGLLFFVASALRKPVEPNWPAPAWIPAMVLLATMPLGRAGRRWLVAGSVLAAAMVLVIYVQALVPILPLPPRRDPMAKAYGWDALGARVGGAMRSAAAGQSSGTRVWAAADRYQDASELAFHVPGRPMVFSLNLGGRHNQYDLWPRFPDLAHPGDALVVALDEAPPGTMPPAIARLAPYFATVQRGELVAMPRDGEIVARRRLWTLGGWRGGWVPGPAIP